MKRKSQPIIKARREYFGGVIFRERPAFVAYVNREYADAYNIPETKGAIMRDGVFSAPLDAHFAITTKCNLHCRGCYSTYKEDDQKDVSMDAAKAVIDKLAALGVLSLSFGGGEPTLHPGIIEIAAYARRRNVLPNMTTNGLAMTEQFAGKCAVFGNVHFSVHGLQDMNHVYSAMRMYRKATGNRPGLNVLLTTETLPHLDGILHEARKSGVRKVLFLRYKTTSINMDVEGLSISDGELEELPLILRRLGAKNRGLMFLFDCSLFEVLAEQDFSDLSTYRKYDSRGCWGGNAYIAIDVNGMLKPCSFWEEHFGSVLDICFDNWVDSPKLNEFRGMRRGDSCSRCEYEELCMGGCRLLHGGCM